MPITINVGKTGLSDTVLEEIKRQLERHGTLKVKFLPSCENRKELVASLADRIGAKKVHNVGFVVVLEKL
ncbi:YhbY family RNA-binding protein [Candidatus Woesearchaeota archaeon]|nr:YhbY family RNA-binding protein [Candidatus Woesearchaeota archaeon]